MKKSTREIGNELEHPVANVFRRLGYRVRQNAEIGGREIDVYAEKEDEIGLINRYAIDCKNYEIRVGAPIVGNCLELFTQLRHEGHIEKGIIVSSIGFSRPAYNKLEHARTKYVELLTMDDLSAVLGRIERLQLDTKNTEDYSAKLIPGVELSDLDEEEIGRLRSIVANGRPSLSKHNDVDFLVSLGLVIEDGPRLRPNSACVLLLGKQKAIERYLPQSEIIFVRYSISEHSSEIETIREPLLNAVELILDCVSRNNPRESLDDGSFHETVSVYPETVIREALLNAIIHRSYEISDAIYVELYEDRIEISNPGSFLPGVTKENILYHPPHHRNRKLAESFQRINWVDRAGQGVNKIFEELLTYGKEPPRYIEYEDSIKLTIPRTVADGGFRSFVKNNLDMTSRYFLDHLLIIHFLRKREEVSVDVAREICQRDSKTMMEILDEMVARGFLEKSYLQIYTKKQMLP